MTKLGVEVSQLSAHPEKWVRTGIQEVIYHFLKSSLELRAELHTKGIELLFFPKIPKFAVPPKSTPLFLFDPLSEKIIDLICEDLGQPIDAICGFSNSSGHIEDHLKKCDAFLTLGLVDPGGLKGYLPDRCVQSSLLYDLVPTFYPETVAQETLPNWFNNEYLPATANYSKNIFSISRSTLLEFLDRYPSCARSGSQEWVYLPPSNEVSLAQSNDCSLVLNKFNLIKNNYFIYLGSMEPRKNLQSVIDGFQTFHEVYRGKNSNQTAMPKLVLSGSAGWKSRHLETQLEQIPKNLWIKTGYLDPIEKDTLIKNAAGLVLLSIHEGYGLPLAEATRHRIPTLSFLGSSLGEAGGFGPTHFYCDPTDPYSVALGFKKLLESTQASDSCSDSPPNTSSPTWRDFTKHILTRAATIG